MGRRNRDRGPSERDGDRPRPTVDDGGGRAWYDRPAADRRSLGAPVVPPGRAWYDMPPLGPERGTPDWATPRKGADAVPSRGPSPAWPDERPLEGSVEGWLGPDEPAAGGGHEPAPSPQGPGEEPRGEAQSPGAVRFFTSGDTPQVQVPDEPRPGAAGDWPAGRSWGEEPPAAQRRRSPEDLASAAGRVWTNAGAAGRPPQDRPHDRPHDEPIRGEHIPPGGRRAAGPGGPEGGSWQGGLGSWQHGLDDSRLLRRMVVSPLDPPFSRTGEFEAVPTAGSGRLPPPPVERPPGRAGRRTGANRSVTAVPPLSPEEEARRAMRPGDAPAADHRRDPTSATHARVDVEDRREPWAEAHAHMAVAPPPCPPDVDDHDVGDGDAWRRVPPQRRDAEALRGWRTVPPRFEPGPDVDDHDAGDGDAWRRVPPQRRDAEALRGWRTVPPRFEPGPDVDDHDGWRSGAPAFGPDVDGRMPHARPTAVEPRRDLRSVPHGPAIPVRPPSRAAAVLGVLAAIGFAWLVLVTLRQPTVPAPPIGAAGARIDEAVAQTLYADRVLSVLGWITNVATLLVLGGVIYRLFVAGPEPGQPGSKHAGPRNARSPQAAPRATSSSAGLRTLRQAAIAGVAAELGSMLVRAVAMSGSGLAAAWDPDMLGFVVAVPFGDAALVRIAGLLLLAALAVPVESPARQAWAQRRNGHHPNGTGTGTAYEFNGRGPAPRPLSERLALEKFACLLGGLVVLASFVLVGHPQATERAPLLAFAQCIHVVAASTWFGGVTFLSIELRQQRREGTARVFAGAIARFSTVAGATVAMAGTTGLVLANSQLASPSALLDTPYGRALLVKLCVLAIPLLLGAYNRQRLVPAVVKRDEPAAWRHLRQTMTAEALLIALGILVATAAMTSGGFY